MKRSISRTRQARELRQLRADLARLVQLVRQQAEAAERRYQLIDQFIDPSMDLQGVILQLVESQTNVVQSLAQLHKQLCQEAETTRSVITRLPKRDKVA